MTTGTGRLSHRRWRRPWRRTDAIWRRRRQRTKLLLRLVVVFWRSLRRRCHPHYVFAVPFEVSFICVLRVPNILSILIFISAPIRNPVSIGILVTAWVIRRKVGVHICTVHTLSSQQVLRDRSHVLMPVVRVTFFLGFFFRSFLCGFLPGRELFLPLFLLR